MKEIVKSVAPIIISKLKKLVANRIKQIHSDSTQINHRIKDIAQIVNLINETYRPNGVGGANGKGGDDYSPNKNRF